MYQFQDPMRVNIPVYPSMNGGILSNPLAMAMNNLTYDSSKLALKHPWLGREE